MDNRYSRRRLLRRLEKVWSRFEITVNRFTGSDYNPFYHLGTLGIYLLLVLTVTGIYLTVFYRPGAEVAYMTVDRISANGFGSLMRSVHRYASDAFLLVTMVHALKILLSDRFWGSRWLAWVSGWGMVVLSWAIGTMGYWLIWDLRSQWMTEVLINNAGGGVALTFLNPGMAGSSFVAFVIVLFVHIFLPVSLLFLIIIHILRLTRGRVWSPRWVMVLSGLALILVSVLKPAASEAPADLGRFIESVRLDAWYLGFLPLLNRLGNSGFWLLTLGFLGVSTLLPWLAKGKHEGPAVIHDPACTGCGLCASECPYRAIEMHYRDDDTVRFQSIAVINSNLCTGCGLCVGTCATLGIELTHMPTDDVWQHGLLAAVQQKGQEGKAPVVVLTCQRHASLGSLPPSLNIAQWPYEGLQGSAPVYLGFWERNGARSETVSCVLPCLGMADVDWVKKLSRGEAKDVLLLGCPFDDCNYREGVQWESARLRRRRSILAPNIQWREAGPGDPRPIPEMMALSALPTEEKQKPEIPHPQERTFRFPAFPIAGVVLAIFSALVALALPVDFLSRSPLAGESQVRVLIQHSGVIGQALENENVTLPEDATVDLAQILGGTRFPVSLQIWIEAEMVLEDKYDPAGIREEGEIFGMGLFTLPPGTYDLELRIMDDGAEWRSVFGDEITLIPSEIKTFIFDQHNDQFLIAGDE